MLRSEYVACPICTRQIPEQDINLHLDLQCPGEATTSRKPSQSNIKSSPPHEIIDILDTPPKIKDSGGAGPSKGNVASIFSKKQVRLEEKPEVQDERPSQPVFTPNERKRSLGKDQASRTEVSEKKPRVNPLTANQP